jgi:hypothetical protein
MLANAQLAPSRDVAASSECVSAIDVIYVRPLGDFRPFEARLLEVVRHAGEGVRLSQIRAAEIRRFTRERVFLSKTAPNLVLVRGGQVVGQAVGDLPARELERAMSLAARAPR